MLTSSSAVGHSARQGIEHERALLHYYVLPFITLSQALSRCRLLHFIISYIRAFALSRFIRAKRAFTGLL